MSGKFMKSKIGSLCAETDTFIMKGHDIWYCFHTKKAYCSASKKYREEKEASDTRSYISAEEDAYYDNFCYRNGI
jgi:hypothetical protein